MKGNQPVNAVGSQQVGPPPQPSTPGVQLTPNSGQTESEFMHHRYHHMKMYNENQQKIMYQNNAHRNPNALPSPHTAESSLFNPDFLFEF